LLKTQRLHLFFHHLDERRYSDLVGMFRPEGRWLRQGQWLEGRTAVHAALDARPPSRVRHVISNAHVATSNDDEATIESYMTAYRDEGPVEGGVTARIAAARCESRCGATARNLRAAAH
jgi:hypothetical protein